MLWVGSLLEISRSEDAADLEWRVPGSDIELLERGGWLLSPAMTFAGWRFYLVFSRKDPSSDSTPLALSLSQPRKSSPSTPFVRYWLGTVKGEDGGREEEEIGRGRMGPGDWHPVFHPWLPLPELRRRMGCSAPPSGTLSFILRLRTGPETDHEMRSLAAREQPASSLEATAEKSTQADFEDVQILQEHFRQLLHSADDHDVLITVKDKQFRAHKNVLRARSPVFRAMFEHKMKESEENMVTIEDIDPDCFGAFLAYIYTGEADNLSAENATALYYAADKYTFPALKRRCADVLKSSLSTSLVCDIITLAATHEEEELLEDALAFFTEHQEEVMETVEWQRFLLSNPTRASEVCLTALRRRRTSGIQY